MLTQLASSILAPDILANEEMWLGGVLPQFNAVYFGVLVLGSFWTPLS